MAEEMKSLFDDLSTFLDITSRIDLKLNAVSFLLGMSGEGSNRSLLLEFPNIIRQMIILVNDPVKQLAKDVLSTLINFSGDKEGASVLLLISESSKSNSDDISNDNLIYLCMKHMTNRDPELADYCTLILSNITRPKGFEERVLTLVEKSPFDWSSFLDVFEKERDTKPKFYYLGPIFSNLSRSKKMRTFLMGNQESAPIVKLLSCIRFAKNNILRGGTIGTIKNCCFDEEYHERLLGPEVDILPYLMMPLMGPDQFTDEENDKLPIDLQYLPETQEREQDPDLRVMLLESLLWLCSGKVGREFLRENNIYIILREYHKWEKDGLALLRCENIVDILIKTEEEIGINSYKEVDVPEEYKEKFEKFDKEFIEENTEEATSEMSALKL
ncbi:hypothetical protein TKK_0006540 [Trichogramma kaykai]|uniref:Protein HGH1 homolog n=1 Tax=Trichogramma kaykai TaxID=54128 RepID=A0ABD2XCL6_9HYME